MTKLVLDYDPILYTAGSVGEERSIKVVHRESGDEYEFPTRTAFWGHWKKRAGGWLAEFNKARKTPRHPDEFDITDIQTPEPISNCLHTMKQIIKGLQEVTQADSYYGYSGRGTTFREELSTIIKYKGNREGMLRPVLLDELKDYLVRFHACKIVEKIEADDACSIDLYDGWQKWKKTKSDKDKVVLAYVDKDYKQCAGHIYNTNKQDGICSYDGFGWLKLDDKGDVDGRGRMWLYHQILSGDTADNYFANSASDMRWGDKSSYKALEGCKTDQEALQAVVDSYKLLYPQPKEIIGWRGDKIEIDWLYVMTENFHLARMLRSRDDEVELTDVLDKLKVSY